MNYIKQLQGDKEQLQNEKLKLEQKIFDLRVYLCSNKFRNDTTVQVQDVLNRLEN